MRQLFLRKIRDCSYLDPANITRKIGTVAPPNLNLDYVPISLEDLLREDLSDAQLTIEPSYFCNLSCKFCDLPINSRQQLNWVKIKPIIQLLALGGLKWSVLAGGEPGISKQTPMIISDLVAMGIRATMLSNGMWAVNKKYLNKVIASGLSEVNVSIKTTLNKNFPTLFGRGSFDIQLTALKYISERIGDNVFDKLLVNYVITMDSIDEIGTLICELSGINIHRLTLTFMEPYTLDAKPMALNSEMLILLSEQLVRFVDKVTFPIELEGFPLCYMNDRDLYSSGIISRKRDTIRISQKITKITLSPKSNADFLSVHYGFQRHLQYMKRGVCSECKENAECIGIHQMLNDEIVPNPFKL